MDWYYNRDPKTATIDIVQNHARDHKAYRFGMKVDPRWSEELKKAYIEAYNSYVEHPV